MTHIDFVVGFLLLMASIFFMIYFVSSSVSNNMNYVSEISLSESSKFIENYLLSEAFSRKASIIEIVLTDTKGSPHTEDLALSIDAVEAKLYSTAWEEGNATYSYTSEGTDIIFTSNLNQWEKKYMRVAHLSGEAQTIYYLSPNNNVSFFAVSGKEMTVFSVNDCSLASYSDLKGVMNTSYDFRLEVGNCTLGNYVPSKTDIKSINTMILAYNMDKIEMLNARLMVW